MKKIISVLFALMMIASVLVVGVSAEIKEPWRDYDNYLFYNDDEGNKRAGYTAEYVSLIVTNEFASSDESLKFSDFPDVSDKIAGIYNSKETPGKYTVVFNSVPWNGLAIGHDTVKYTAGDIDDFLAIFDYVKSLSFVKKAIPSYVTLSDNGKEPTHIDLLEAVPGGGEDWREYDNYLYYNNADRKKDRGYTVDYIKVTVTDEFVSSGVRVDASCFPGIEDKIIEIRHNANSSENRYTLVVNKVDSQSEYTKDDIDRFLEQVDYVDSLWFVKDVTAIHSNVVNVGPPIPSSTTEAETGGTGENEGSRQGSLQTGDDILLYVSLAFVFGSALALTSILMKKKREI